MTGAKQTTDGGDANGYTTGYTYNLSGALIDETYPSGRVVQNALNNNGDLSMVESKKNANAGFWSYANSFTYNPAGAVTSMQLGNGHWESTVFNSRLQPTEIALGKIPNATDLLKLDYTYNSTGNADNNGNVLSQTITVPTVGSNNGFVAIQNYSYDSLNRLKDATENVTPNGGSASQSWKQTFTFDRYGNRRFDEPNTTQPSSFANQAITDPTVNPANNRLNATGYSFDNAGNTTADAEGRTFIYNAENKQVEVKDASSNVVGDYFYDGDGKRVKKIVPSTGEETIFVYDASGKSIAEYSTVVASVNDAKVNYLTADHLGSPRISTDQNGAVTARHDYMPFGEEIGNISGRAAGVGYGDDSVRKGFADYERDDESGLELAGARYYANLVGRFASADPLLSSGLPAIPQSWHRYSYSLNNPLNLTDPLGLYVCSGTTTQCELFAAKLAEDRADLEKIKATYGEKSTQYTSALAAVTAYGNDETGEKTNNGVIVKFDWKKSGGDTSAIFNNKTGKLVGTITVHFNPKDLESESFQDLVAHEGSHVHDDKTVGRRPKFDPEFDAYTVQSLFAEAQYPTGRVFLTITPPSIPATRTSPAVQPQDVHYDLWNSSWNGPDKETLRSNAIKAYLAVPKSAGGQYELTPPASKTPARRIN